MANIFDEPEANEPTASKNIFDDADVTLTISRNIFDDDGPAPEIPQSVQMLVDIDALRPDGTPYFAPGQREYLKGIPAEDQAQQAKELLGPGLEIPWIDPVSAGAGGFVAGARTGVGLLGKLGRGLVSGGTGAVADVPLGMATEAVEDKHPWLALPFSVLVGMGSAKTIEPFFDKKIMNIFSKFGTKITPEQMKLAQDAVHKGMTTGKSEEEIVESIGDLALKSQLPKVEPIKTTAEQKLERPITDLAREATLPKKPGFQRTAEDLLQEQVDLGKFKASEVPDATEIPKTQGVRKAQAVPKSKAIPKSKAVPEGSEIPKPGEIPKASEVPRGTTDVSRKTTYLKRGDTDTVVEAGGKTHVTDKKTGTVLPGKVIDKSDVPKKLFHVTTNPKGVKEAGAVRDVQGGVGLGKGTGPAHKGVSTTTSLESAKMVRREMLRQGELARGDAPIEELIMKYAREDAKRAGLSESAYDNIAKVAVGSYKVNVKKAKDPGKVAMEAHNMYLVGRESAGGMENPIIFMDSAKAGRLHEGNVKIIDIDGDDIPGDALIRKNPAGNHLDEIFIHGEVPVKSTARGIHDPNLKPGEVPAKPPGITDRDKFKKPQPAGKLDPQGREATRQMAEKLLTHPEDVDKIDKMVDSINLDRLDTDDKIKDFMVKLSDEVKPLIKRQQRGVQDFTEIQNRAIRSGLTEKQMLKIKPGTVLSAEKSLSASMINLSSARRTQALAQKVRDGGSDTDILEFRLALERHIRMQAIESGLATEAGRTLSARRIVKDHAGKPVQNLKHMIDALGGETVNVEMARRLALIDPSDMGAINRFIQQATKASTADKFFEIYINSLLSSLTTHAVNFTSNALTLASKLPEKAVSAGFDSIRAGFTGKPRTRLAGELGAELFAVKAGLYRGLRNGMWALKTGLPSDAQSKLETRSLQAIKGPVGEIVRIPGRMLVASDEFFKGVNGVMEMHAQAYRKATLKGLTGELKTKEIDRLLKDPTHDMMEAVEKERLYRVFQANLGETGRNIGRLRIGQTPGAHLFRFIAPFYRTPVNIAKFGLERSPLGFIGLAGKALSKGGIELGEGTDRFARATMGTILGATAYSLAQDGVISGAGPKDHAERASKIRDGWLPYAILKYPVTGKPLDKPISFARLEPMSTVLGMSADLQEAMDRRKYDDPANIKLAGSIIESFSKNITSKTYLQGVSEFVDVISDSERNLEPFLKNKASVLVLPRIVAGSARAYDEYLRDTPDVSSYIKSQIPLASTQLAISRNIWGEPMFRSGSGAERLISPFKRTEVRGNKADREMVKLGMGIGKPSRKIGDVELTPQQYEKLMIAGGRQAKDEVIRVIESSGYQNLPAYRKINEIRQAYSRGFNRERDKLKRQLPQEPKR